MQRSSERNSKKPGNNDRTNGQAELSRKGTNESSSSMGVAPNALTDEDASFLKSFISRLMDAKNVKWKKHNYKKRPPLVTKSEIVRICQLAVEAFNNQPTLLKIKGDSLPITICADLHGQFCDLRIILREIGPPPATNWLFLGDFVDRGAFGVEIACLLFAYKIVYPNNCFMLRGNHEDYNTSMVYGFYDECLDKYGDSDRHLVWLSFINVFNHMPLAALLADGRVLAMHGGISPFIRRLDDILQIKRPTCIPLYGLACDLVWSDPGSTNPGWSTSTRSVSFTFDESTIDEFCRRHDIDLIVRGHQIHESWQDKGYKMTDNCKLVTIFSAPKYGGFHNTGTVLNISKQMECKFHLFRPESKREVKVWSFLKSFTPRSEMRKTSMSRP